MGPSEEEIGPFEQEIAQILSDAMGKTTLGLEIRVEGAAPAVQKAIEALGPEQRSQIFLEALTGWSEAVRRVARRIDEADRARADERDD